jgi:TNF receptor-associated factor 4
VKEANKPCPLCNEPDYTMMLHKGVMREVNSLAIYCTEKARGCDWTGDLGQLNCHLNLGSRDSGCGFVVMECVHCGEKLARSDIAKHEMEECLNLPMERQVGSLSAQLKLALTENRENTSRLTDKINAVDTRNQELEAKCAAMESKNEELESRNASLESTIIEMQARVDTIEAEKDGIKNRVGMLESLAMKVFRLENRQTSTTRRIDEFEENVTKRMGYLEVECSAVETRLTPTPPYYFTLCNFHHYQQSDFHWECDPFYSFSKGYKFYISIHPYGTRKCRGTHLSIYACLLRGEYDDQLEWPFQGAVFVELYNHATRAWDSKPEVEFEPTDDVKFTGRPSDARSNPGLGYPNWVPLGEVNMNYCHNDMVRFRVVKITVASNVYLPME